MSTVKTWLLYVVGCAFGWSIILSGCASTPQILIVPPIADRVEPPPYGTKDYAQTLAAIMSVMVLDLKLPAVEASVTLYPSQASYESGVIAESERDRERLRKQLGSGADQLREDELVLAARRSAVSSHAVGMYRKVLVNEWRVSKYRWPEWIRLLAHELTHTAQRELVNGGLSASDQWLREGFAEWVGYKVADRFGAENFAKSHGRVLDLISTVKSYQTFPSLGQLASNAEWLTWLRTLGIPATYGQAFIAVDFLIEQKGLAAVVEYFRLFGKLNNRQRNFMTAFGESVAGFDKRFSVDFARRIGK